MEKYGSTAYGPMAALAAAKTDYEAGDVAGAATLAAVGGRPCARRGRRGDRAAAARWRTARSEEV